MYRWWATLCRPISSLLNKCKCCVITSFFSSWVCDTSRPPSLTRLIVCLLCSGYVVRVNGSIELVSSRSQPQGCQTRTSWRRIAYPHVDRKYIHTHCDCGKKKAGLLFCWWAIYSCLFSCFCQVASWRHTDCRKIPFQQHKHTHFSL